jgi:leader peptidase (prepilin peptidase)/N-methyltransferase
VTSGWLISASALYGWTLLALAWIDQRHQLLPDALTLPLLPAGLAVAWTAVGNAWPDHLIGAVSGFAAFYAIGVAYRHLRKRPGLGLGDAKLLAGIGAWVAWQGLASVVLLAALSGLLLVLARRFSGRPLELAERLPFGPHLALGGWLVWLHGPVDMAN